MKAVVAPAPSTDPQSFNIEIVERPKPQIGDGQCLVEIQGASVNASDIKGLQGNMHNLVWPRIPGRDYAGRVVAGPADRVGREVWGSGADLGMSRDGAHAQLLVVETASLHDKPANISMLEAAGIGVPFCTAQIGLVDYAAVREGETVAVMGLNGKVGQAVAQLATLHGARVIGIERAGDTYLGHATGPVETVNASRDEWVGAVLEKTDGRGADIVFNTVGEPYFRAAHRALTMRGRQVIINALEKETSIDLTEFYRKRLQLFGMASMGFDAVAMGHTLAALKPGFESGALRPYPVDPQTLFTLDEAEQAYRAMLAGNTKSRVLIDPQG